MAAEAADLCVEGTAIVASFEEGFACPRVERLSASPYAQPRESVGFSEELLRIVVALCKGRRCHSDYQQRNTHSPMER